MEELSRLLLRTLAIIDIRTTYTFDGADCEEETEIVARFHMADGSEDTALFRALQDDIGVINEKLSAYGYCIGRLKCDWVNHSVTAAVHKRPVSDYRTNVSWNALSMTKNPCAEIKLEAMTTHEKLEEAVYLLTETAFDGYAKYQIFSITKEDPEGSVQTLIANTWMIGMAAPEAVALLPAELRESHHAL